MDEFTGHLDQVFFRKFFHSGNVTSEVSGTWGPVIKGLSALMSSPARRSSG
jgi:hypothetical protein